MRHDHRWMMALRKPPPNVIYQLWEQPPSSKFAIWMSGNNSTPVRIQATAISTGATRVIGDESLSPDGTKVVWVNSRNGSPEQGNILIADAPGGITGLTLVSSAPSWSVSLLGWHPDGSSVYYMLYHNVSGAGNFIEYEFRRINIDGSGDTLIMASPGPEIFWTIGGPVNRSGEYIAWYNPFQILPTAHDAGYYVLDVASGVISAARIFTGRIDDGIIGWSRVDPDVFYFTERPTDSTPYPYRICKMNVDGSGYTVLATWQVGPDPFGYDSVFLPTAIGSLNMAPLANSSAEVISANDDYMIGVWVPDPADPAGDTFIAKLWLDGSANVDIIGGAYPLQLSTIAQLSHRPLMYADRVYFNKIGPTGYPPNEVASIRRDNGSIYRTDHDLGNPATDNTFYGFTGPGV